MAHELVGISALWLARVRDPRGRDHDHVVMRVQVGSAWYTIAHAPIAEPFSQVVEATAIRRALNGPAHSRSSYDDDC